MKILVDVPFHNKEKTIAHVGKKLIPKIFQEFDLNIVLRNPDIWPTELQ